MASHMTTVEATGLGAGDLPADVFKMIVDLTANPFVVIRPDGLVLYAGESVERLLGWKPDQIAGKNIVEFLPPDQVELAIEAVAEIDQIDRGGARFPHLLDSAGAAEPWPCPRGSVGVAARGGRAAHRASSHARTVCTVRAARARARRGARPVAPPRGPRRADRRGQSRRVPRTVGKGDRD